MENTLKTAIFSLFAAVLLVVSGCASSSDDIGKAYVSHSLYKDYDCDELAAEAAHISQRVKELAQSLDSEATKDVWQTTSAFVLAVPTFGWSLGILGALEGGDGPEANEYARLKGEYEAVSQMAKRKKCRIDGFTGIGVSAMSDEEIAAVREECHRISTTDYNCAELVEPSHGMTSEEWRVLTESTIECRKNQSLSFENCLRGKGVQ